MRRRTMVLAATALLAAGVLGGCSAREEPGAADAPKAAALPEGAEPLGEPITVTEAPVPLATVRANPEAYFEKTILVEATAQDICQKAGCWMTIVDGDGEPIWVRWSSGCGGQYAFPKDAQGRRLLVQGSFYAKEIAPEDAEHIAGESPGMKMATEDIAGKTFEMNATACVLLPANNS